MTESSMGDRGIAPAAMIRRFDVFAEYNRIKNEHKGMPMDQAKGYALWLAKVIAARTFARTPETRAKLTERLALGRQEMRAGARFPVLGGEPQTDEMFGREVISRMGPEFYREEFSPAIEAAIANHRSYESIRDALRMPWNFRRKAA